MGWKKLNDFPNQRVIKPSYDSKIIYWKVENGKVWHQWKKLMKADIESFEIYDSNDFIGRDKDFIYHAWTKLTKVDRDTFQEVGDSYWKDKNYAFVEYETSIQPLKGLEIEGFQYLGNGFAHDNSFAYFYGKVIKSCHQPTTLKLISEDQSYARDSENIYYESAVLKNADPKTWKLLGKGFSSDEKRVFFTARKLPKVDINTWEHIYRAYSKDKNHVYCMEQIQEDKPPKDWDIERVKEHYEK